SSGVNISNFINNTTSVDASLIEILPKDTKFLTKLRYIPNKYLIFGAYTQRFEVLFRSFLCYIFGNFGGYL
ncbi:MAG: hypothetical protein IIV72_03890, partial [Alistipes sp.]|nr:hypothetical protein [Alistipes sp.]